jgi:hypothetical protein
MKQCFSQFGHRRGNNILIGFVLVLSILSSTIITTEGFSVLSQTSTACCQHRHHQHFDGSNVQTNRRQNNDDNTNKFERRYITTMMTKTDDDDEEIYKDDKESDTSNRPQLRGGIGNQTKIDEKGVPSFPLLPAIIATMLFVSFWPLLAVIRNGYIDVDMYMVLKGILDDKTNVESSTTILELPPLSPAERLVDAIFGPPQ